MLTREPDLDAVPANTPPGVVRLLRRCLTKKSKDRLRDIGDARIELANLDGERSILQNDAAPRALRLQRSVLSALVIVLLAWLIASLMSRPGRSDRGVGATLSARWAITLPEGSVLDWHRTSRNFSKLGGGSPLLALSPDGETIVFSVSRGDASQLYRQRLDELEATPIGDTQDARGPFFSPDGKWLGFLADNALQVVSLERGGARRVCDISSQNFAGGWTGDGESIVYSTNTGIWRVGVQGGEPESLVAPERQQGEREFSLSSLLPDGSGVLFTTGTTREPVVMLLELDSGDLATVMTEAAHARYLTTGHLIYAHDRVLWSVPFDPATREASEAPTPLLEGVHTTLGAGGSPVAHYAVAGNGVLVYVPAPDTPPTSSLVWVDRHGNEETIVEGPGKWEHPRVSPDGQRIAFDTLDDLGKDIYIVEVGRGQLARLTTNGATTASLWAKDGSRVLGADLASNGIASIAADFSGRTGHYPNAGPTIPGGWGPEGRTLVFTERDSMATDTWAIGTVEVDVPDAEPRTFLGSAAIERWPSLSPDGRFMAYVADESGTQQVFVQPFPGLDRKVKVSTDGGGEPVWSKDGTELFFRAEGRVF
ncbi:MAG: hypothetical protein R3344_10540, partial [Acidobacteriota bacterium]|nr:hypothetical protein [Acidobacteriota bacterium]